MEIKIFQESRKNASYEELNTGAVVVLKADKKCSACLHLII
ncbi:hypothetical protein [Bartonella gabonensis]|nr:hypothetical protein [Bartonella gabonensis]